MKAPSEAQIEHIKRDAAKGVVYAQYMLGTMYFTGKGLSQNYDKAIEWYTRAAEQGDVTAQTALYSIYRKGTGVKPDQRKAAEWVTKAAQAGHLQCQSNLGVMYLEGRGVAKNPPLAYAWLLNASTYGYKHWVHRLTRALARLTLSRQELQEAVTIVRTWEDEKRKQALQKPTSDSTGQY